MDTKAGIPVYRCYYLLAVSQMFVATSRPLFIARTGVVVGAEVISSFSTICTGADQFNDGAVRLKSSCFAGCVQAVGHLLVLDF